MPSLLPRKPSPYTGASPRPTRVALNLASPRRYPPIRPCSLGWDDSRTRSPQQRKPPRCTGGWPTPTRPPTSKTSPDRRIILASYGHWSTVGWLISRARGWPRDGNYEARRGHVIGGGPADSSLAV